MSKTVFWRRGVVAVALIGMAGSVAAQDGNPAACVETFDEATNYFSEQVTVEYAEGFEVEYFSNYKLVTVTQPWAGAEDTFSYVLVQCGTPPPDGYDDATIIEVPISTAVSMSTTYLPHFVELDLIDSLVGVDETDFAYNPDVLERAASGEILEIGGGATVNVEQALDLSPDVIFTYGIGAPDYDAYPVLGEAGLDVVLNGDYVETTPLGRAEWIKFTALFFNAEAEANAFFDGVEARYNDLAELAASADERPTVLTNGLYADTWYVSGGASFVAQFIADAGGDYVFADDTSTGGVPLSFEAVFDAGQNADVWINPNFWFSLADGLAEDERYAEFTPFSEGNVWNNNLRVTDLGGNDFTEGGVTNPDLVLADLIAIFHPELLPDHEFTYYRPLE